VSKAGATGLEPALYRHDPPKKGAVEVLTVGAVDEPVAELSLLDEATARFRAIGLDWRADEVSNLRKRTRK
jgi:hypothetical protein